MARIRIDTYVFFRVLYRCCCVTSLNNDTSTKINPLSRMRTRCRYRMITSYRLNRSFHRFFGSYLFYFFNHLTCYIFNSFFNLFNLTFNPLKYVYETSSTPSTLIPVWRSLYSSYKYCVVTRLLSVDAVVNPVLSSTV